LAGQRDLEHEEDESDCSDLQKSPPGGLHGQQRQQGVGNRIQSCRATARRGAEATLDEAGAGVTQHRAIAKQSACCGRLPKNAGAKRGRRHSCHHAANRPRRTQRRPPVEKKVRPPSSGFAKVRPNHRFAIRGAVSAMARSKRKRTPSQTSSTHGP